MNSYEPTEKQTKVLEKLEHILDECKKNDIILFDNYGTLTAINGISVKSLDMQQVGNSVPLDDNLAWVSLIYDLQPIADDQRYVTFTHPLIDTHPQLR